MLHVGPASQPPEVHISPSEQAFPPLHWQTPSVQSLAVAPQPMHAFPLVPQNAVLVPLWHCEPLQQPDAQLMHVGPPPPVAPPPPAPPPVAPPPPAPPPSAPPASTQMPLKQTCPSTHVRSESHA
jgi:hypothetical protein